MASFRAQWKLLRASTHSHHKQLDSARASPWRSCRWSPHADGEQPASTNGGKIARALSSWPDLGRRSVSCSMAMGLMAQPSLRKEAINQRAAQAAREDLARLQGAW